ncbi:hypothetical protein C8R44DRAFT_725336 [Mycena epipterygia]|nr:hypothetical protein C8R44DRAFT_725336 [Mycena epipterygia]
MQLMSIPHVLLAGVTSTLGFLTGASLTIPLTSLEPSPTVTGSDISAAYAAYTQACGTPLAQAEQDALATHNNVENTGEPITNVSDPRIQLFLEDYPPWSDAHRLCVFDQDSILNFLPIPTQSNLAGGGGESATTSKGGGSATTIETAAPATSTGSTSSVPAPTHTTGRGVILLPLPGVLNWLAMICIGMHMFG